MSLDDVVNVTITANTKAPSRAGFGTPLIAAYHTAWLDRVREYDADLDALVTDFPATTPVYKCAAKMLSQNPHPPKLKVGRRASAPTQTVDLTPTNTTVGFVYKPKIGGEQASYTVQSGDAVSDITAALETAINALTGAFTATDVGPGTKLTVAADVAGALFDYEQLDGFTVKDVTTDPGIAADLNAIVAEDDDWYGLALDSNSHAEVLATAAWVETKKKIFAYHTRDSLCLDSGDSTDIMSVLKAAAYARSFGLFSKAALQSYSGAAWLANRLPFDPGSATWAFKTLPGITVDNLNATERSAIEGASGNHYTVVAGINVTRWGKSASGEYIDVTRFMDWLHARLQESVFGILANNQKIPYTDSGVDQVRAQVLAVLTQGVDAGGLAADPAPSVTVPKVADVATADKANRILPDVKFEGILAGAIHSVKATGVLSL